MRHVNMTAMQRSVTFVFAALALGSAACNANSSSSFSHPPVEPNAGTFLIAVNPPNVRARTRHTATVLDNGHVLLVGGLDGVGPPVQPAERYVAGPQEFRATSGGLITARARHSATFLTNGDVLIAGGVGLAGFLDSAEIYGPLGDAFIPAAGNLITARQNHTASLTNDGTVLVVGGDAGGPPIAAMERFVPTTGFQPAGNLLTARTRHTAVRRSNGEIVILGGFGPTGAAIASVEILHLSDGSPRAAMQGLNIARAGAGAATFGDGRILLAGGTGVTGQALDSVEVYDPVAERSFGAGTMSRTRANARVAPLFDGRFLITGDDNTADIYDPSRAQIVQPTGALAQTRSGHTTTPVGTGDVVIVGGSPPNAPAELFDPR